MPYNMIFDLRQLRAHSTSVGIHKVREPANEVEWRVVSQEITLAIP
jgi:hypothetical protein